MPCGCQTACGCQVEAGPGVRVQRIGDKFIVTNTAFVRVVQRETDSAVVATGTTVLLYEGGAGESVTLATAVEGYGVEVWNVSADDLELVAAGGDTVNGVASVTIPAGYSADVFSPAAGEWLANVH